MSHRDHNRIFSIHFYATAPYPCSYLPGRQARSQVAIPADAIDDAVYSQLAYRLRRSGLFTYRPYCDDCDACVSVRIPVARFVANRTQRRHMAPSPRRLFAVRRELRFEMEHYALYRRYQVSRHADGSMADDNHHQYAEFILKAGEQRAGGIPRRTWPAQDGQPDSTNWPMARRRRTPFEPDDASASYGGTTCSGNRRNRVRGLSYLYLATDRRMPQDGLTKPPTDRWSG